MSDDLEFRSIPFADLEVRDNADDQGGWTLEGIAVPYGQVVEVGDYKEQIERGAFGDYDGSSLLFSAHDHQSGGLPIGSITETEDRQDGLFIKAKISATAKGTEVRQLLRDKVLKSLSVGFQPVEQHDQDGVVVRTKARLREVSVVPFPAYANAAVTAVRSAPPTPSASADDNPKEAPVADTIQADVTEVRSHIEDLSRRFTVLEERGAAPVAAACKFNSLGEFVKGLATRSATREDAEMLTRAFTGATLADANAQPAWVNRDIRLVQENRPILNLFSKAPLPATGMSIEYPVFGSKSGDVAVQANEGDDLTYLELVVTDANAPVRTYGGYSSLSRQAIERSDVPYLNKVLDMQKISYAKVTNGAVRTALTAATGTNTGVLTFANRGKGDAWVNVALQALVDIDANSTGLTGDVWIMGMTQFQQLAGITDTAGRPVFVINGSSGTGVNTYGGVDIKGFRANIAGVPVFVDTKLTGTNSYIVSTDAITVMESGPWNLADENIVNLTKDFSLYGYLAMTVNDVKGVAKISHPVS